VRAGIAVGSNLGDRLSNLKSARDAIARLADGANVIASCVYETDAVACEPGASRFYNAVLEIEYAGSARDLLGQLRTIEAQLGRPTKHVRNTSRTIDLDLLYFDDEQLDTSDLELPHPRLHERHFVLAPLADIRPGLVLPNQSCSVGDLLANVRDSARVERAREQW
jgi:2-amino-4-hydroxy-6-hydroxymethyldihydropteridine diphosphokinase